MSFLQTFLLPTALSLAVPAHEDGGERWWQKKNTISEASEEGAGAN